MTDRPTVLPRSSSSGRVGMLVQLRKTTLEGVCTTDIARHSTRSRGSAPISRSVLRFRPSMYTPLKPMASRKRLSASLTSSGDGVATPMRRAPRTRRVAMTALVAVVAGMPEAVSRRSISSWSHPGPWMRLPLVQANVIRLTSASASCSAASSRSRERSMTSSAATDTSCPGKRMRVKTPRTLGGDALGSSTPSATGEPTSMTPSRPADLYTLKTITYILW